MLAAAYLTTGSNAFFRSIGDDIIESFGGHVPQCDGFSFITLREGAERVEATAPNDWFAGIKRQGALKVYYFLLDTSSPKITDTPIVYRNKGSEHLLVVYQSHVDYWSLSVEHSGGPGGIFYRLMRVAQGAVRPSMPKVDMESSRKHMHTWLTSAKKFYEVPGLKLQDEECQKRGLHMISQSLDALESTVKKVKGLVDPERLSLSACQVFSALSYLDLQVRMGTFLDSCAIAPGYGEILNSHGRIIQEVLNLDSEAGSLIIV